MKPTLVILVVGLSPELVGAHTPNLKRLSERGAMRALEPVRPAVLQRRFYASGLVLTTAAAAAGLVYHWPRMPGWWRQEVWWEEKTAREGMGMMIVVLVLLVVLLTAWRARPRPAAAN